mmetsp:Transcript_64252/g.169776  ORF Transcript_64252/g.169776 Transcript_64252/m.169776 type:complete len:235 (+) Transcript_64252:225-929(+)
MSQNSNLAPRASQSPKGSPAALLGGDASLLVGSCGEQRLGAVCCELEGRLRRCPCTVRQRCTRWGRLEGGGGDGAIRVHLDELLVVSYERGPVRHSEPRNLGIDHALHAIRLELEVKCRRGLVHDRKLGLGVQQPRKADALLLAQGQRVLPHRDAVEAKLVQSRLEAQIDEEAGDLRVALHLGRLHLRVDHLLPQRAVAHVRALRQDEHAAAPDVKRALDRAAVRLPQPHDAPQ